MRDQDASVHPDVLTVPCDNEYFVSFDTVNPAHTIVLERWHGGEDYYIDDAFCGGHDSPPTRLHGIGCAMTVTPGETLGFRVVVQPLSADGTSERIFPCSFDPAEEAAIGRVTVECGSEIVRVQRVPDSTGCAYRAP